MNHTPRYDPNRHRRQSIRLKGRDYSRPGMYFVTICAAEPSSRFGEVEDKTMRLNDAGNMVASEWRALPDRFLLVDMDAFVVMPNHFHGIISISTHRNFDVDVGAGLVPAPPDVRATIPPDGGTPTLGDIVGAFKSITTVRYSRAVLENNWPPFPGRLWQRNYYERIIRKDQSLHRIRRYIWENPPRWRDDQYHPARHPNND